jgi:hypothetical protein
MESSQSGLTSANATTRRNQFNSYVRSGMMYSPLLFFYIVVGLFFVMLVMAVVMGSSQQGGGAVAMGALCFLVFIVILCIISFGFIQEQKSQ